MSRQHDGALVGDDDTVVAGLVYDVVATVDGVPAINCTWSVPGDVIAGYDVSPASAAVVPLTDLMSNPIQVAFWQSGTYTFYCEGEDPTTGEWAEGQSDFACLAPSGDIVGTIGAVRAGTGEGNVQWLQLAADDASPLGGDQTGITLDGTVYDAPAAGTIGFFQLVTPSRAGVRSGAAVAWSLNGQTVLDAAQNEVFYQGETAQIAQGGQQALPVTDCPALAEIVEQNWTTLSVTAPAEVFSTYLMYVPDQGIPIPVSAISWWWQGQTVQTNGAWGGVTGNGQDCPNAGQDATGFPVWNTTQANGTWP
jgi:hypothetical protein